MKLAIVAAALCLTAAPASSHAAAWKQVTAAGGSGIDQVSALRTADGVLHVAWHRQSGPNTTDLFHTRIAPDGKVGATTSITAGWAGIEDAALTPVPGGIRAFWGGIRTTESTEPNRDLNTALSTDGGATWTLQIGSIVPGDAQAYASDVSAATLPDGTTLQAWYGTLGTWVHAGLDPASPNVNYQAPLGSYGNLPGLAVDAAGRAMMAWFSSASGHVGVLAQEVGAGGASVGSVLAMPGTQVMVGNGTIARTPVVARAKSGGFYVAYPVGYPSPGEIRLWKVGASAATLIARADGNPAATVAADPKGRLWVVWSDGTFGSKRILAARSNRTATQWGEPVDAGVVKNANSVYSLDAAATSSALDVLALFGVGTESGGSTYVTRIQPGLTLRARRATTRTTFSVTDAGDPVKGAVVKVGGRSGKTDSEGRVKLPVKAGKATATATATGYAPAKLRLK